MKSSNLHSINYRRYRRRLDYENYSYKEIAEITSLSETQVKVYIFRARNFMKDFIRKPELIL